MPIAVLSKKGKYENQTLLAYVGRDRYLFASGLLAQNTHFLFVSLGKRRIHSFRRKLLDPLGVDLDLDPAGPYRGFDHDDVRPL